MRSPNAHASAAARAAACPSARKDAGQKTMSTAQEARPMIPIRLLVFDVSLALGVGVCAAASAQGVAPTSASVAPESIFSPRDEPSDPAPAGSPPLHRAEDGITAVAGRVLETEGAPLQGVVLKIG